MASNQNLAISTHLGERWGIEGTEDAGAMVGAAVVVAAVVVAAVVIVVVIAVVIAVVVVAIRVLMKMKTNRTIPGMVQTCLQL